MFHFISRIIKNVQMYPKSIFWSSTIISIIAIIVISTLPFRFDLLNIFPEDLPAAKEAKHMQEQYGGFGKLTVIIQSPDSSANLAIAQKLTPLMAKNELVKFSEYKNENEFFIKNKLLYIDLKDLKDIEQRISDNITSRKRQANPLFVSLSDNKNKNQDHVLELKDLEAKYTKSLKKYLGSTDATTLLFNIYPNYDIYNTKLNQDLYQYVDSHLKELTQNSQIKTFMVGEIYTSAKSVKRLYRDLKYSIIITGIILFLILMFFFIKHPMTPIALIISLIFAVIWTFALTAAIFGNINIYTYTIAFILISLGIDSGIHLLARYEEERRKMVSPKIAMEFAILGVGPTISASAFTTAAAFFCLALIPFRGVREFGIIAGLGIILTWIHLVVILPGIVVKLQEHRSWKVFGSRQIHFKEYKHRFFKVWPRLMALIILVTMTFLLTDFYPKFEYDFEKLNFNKTSKEKYAENINRHYDNSYSGLSFISADNLEDSEALTKKLRAIKKDDPTPTIKKIYNLNSILPQDQDEKLKIIQNIQKLLNPRVMQYFDNLDSVNQKNIKKITSSWDLEKLTVDDLPNELTNIFNYQNDEHLTFIFSNIDEYNGKECRQLLKDIRQIDAQGKTYYATGKAILTAEMLNLILPYMRVASLISFIVIIMILFIHQNTTSRVLFIITPTLFATLWFFGFLELFNLKVNPFNVILFPILFGISIDGTLHIYQRFREEGIGSVYFILSRTGKTVVIATLTSILGFISLCFSPHKGLQSIGFLALIGLVSIILSHTIILPALMGITERLRVIKKIKRSKNNLHS